MIEEARAAIDQPSSPAGPSGSASTAGLRPMPRGSGPPTSSSLQVSYSTDAISALARGQPVRSSRSTPGSWSSPARPWHGGSRATIPDIDIPDDLIERVKTDPSAGVDAACEQVLALRESGAVAGVHLVPVSRFREVAARLEKLL